MALGIFKHLSLGTDASATPTGSWPSPATRSACLACSAGPPARRVRTGGVPRVGAGASWRRRTSLGHPKRESARGVALPPQEWRPRWLVGEPATDGLQKSDRASRRVPTAPTQAWRAGPRRLVATRAPGRARSTHPRGPTAGYRAEFRTVRERGEPSPGSAERPFARDCQRANGRTQPVAADRPAPPTRAEVGGTGPARPRSSGGDRGVRPALGGGRLPLARRAGNQVPCPGAHTGPLGGSEASTGRNAHLRPTTQSRALIV